jgi:hypothetical protein
MKIFNIGRILILLALYNNIFAQNEIKIVENTSAEICGHYVIVDGIWVNEGIIKADISVLENQNSKPITGGYKKGDEITISNNEDCKYYIFSVSKSGKNESKGIVVLSKTPPPESLQKCEDYLSFYQSGKHQIDTLEVDLRSVDLTESLHYTANIDLSYKSNLVSSISLKKNDYLWTGECLYMAETISPASKDKIPDPSGMYEVNPAKVFFKKVNEYFYPSTGIIKGEEINKPKETLKSEYIIRKALLYKGKKPTEEELKNTKAQLWLLQVFYYSRGGAARLIKIERDGKTMMVEFDAVKTFKNEDEALEYAKQNGITDINLEEK